MSFKSLSGFRDFYPESCRSRDALFAIWRRCADEFGFEPYDGPPLETLDLYKKKSGEEIVGQLYNFTDKGGREVSLRPEMTPTLARMAGAAHREYRKPLKWSAIPQLFRYERAQKGRLREHFQWNCDIIGEADLGADAELLSLLAHFFRQVGLGPDAVEIRVSDRLFWKDFLAERGVSEDRHYDFFQAIDKLDREPREKTEEKLGVLSGDVFAAIEAARGGPRIGRLLELLAGSGAADYVRVDLGIVRGLAYYTGVVFEAHDKAGEFRAIAGGGRYDDLLKNLSGVDLPALGFGMGDVVIGELLKEKGIELGADRPRLLYVVIPDEAFRGDALALVAALRAGGYRVDYPLSPAKVGRQFETAEGRGATHALVLDGSWKERGEVGWKDLAARSQVAARVEIREGRVVSIDPLP